MHRPHADVPVSAWEKELSDNEKSCPNLRLEVVAHLRTPKKGSYAGQPGANLGKPEERSELYDYEELVRLTDVDRVLNYMQGALRRPGAGADQLRAGAR